MREQIVQGPIKRLTLRIPVALIARTQQRAGATRRSLNRYIVETVEQQVEQVESAPMHLSESEVVLMTLQQSGLLVQPGTEWEGLLSGRPVKTHAEIMEMMSGQRPLSEDIIEMRGEL